MSAGLPGLGLGGLFFIFSALLAPIAELWRAVRGRSSAAAWREVARQFAQAVMMIVATDLTIRLAFAALSVFGLADAPALDAGTVLPLTLIGITLGLLVFVLFAAKLGELVRRSRTQRRRRRRSALPVPLRALAAMARDRR